LPTTSTGSPTTLCPAGWSDGSWPGSGSGPARSPTGSWVPGDSARDSMQDTVSGAADKARDAAARAGEKAQETAQSIAGTVRATPDAVARKTQGNPLAAGVIAFGVSACSSHRCCRDRGREARRCGGGRLVREPGRQGPRDRARRGQRPCRHRQGRCRIGQGHRREAAGHTAEQAKGSGRSTVEQITHAVS
jgi:hypothetical protein